MIHNQIVTWTAFAILAMFQFHDISNIYYIAPNLNVPVYLNFEAVLDIEWDVGLRYVQEQSCCHVHLEISGILFVKQC